MKALVLAAAVVLGGGFAVTAEAQTTVAVDLAKTALTWDHADVTKVVQFVVKCGTTSGVYSLPEKLVAAPAMSIPIAEIIPGPGKFFCTVGARNQFGTTDGTEIAFEAGTAPPAPTNLRIISK